MKKKKQLMVLSSVLFALLASFLVAEGQRQTVRHKSVASRATSDRRTEVRNPLGVVDATGVYNVRAFGAKGDGEALDTTAINKAIEIAAAGGGGTVRFPAGNYLSVSSRLKSNITLYLDQGATIVAAEPSKGFKYDPPEPNSRWY